MKIQIQSISDLLVQMSQCKVRFNQLYIFNIFMYIFFRFLFSSDAEPNKNETNAII